METNPKAPNAFTQEEWNSRVTKLMLVIENKSKGETDQIKELFNLHNDRFLPAEFGTHCGSCVARVYQRVKKYYTENLKPQDPTNTTNDNGSNA